MLFVWGKWLPYHFARVQACADCFNSAGYSVVGVQYSDVSIDYRINSSARTIDFDFLKPHLGKHETDFLPLRIIKCWPRLLARHSVKVVFVPSYWHWSATIAAVSRACGCRVVMMNESHAGTEQATGWRKKIKKQLIRLFDAALVGGEPHKRHFAALGIPADKIFTGYDAVDNAHFAARAGEVRSMEHGAGSVEQERIRLRVRHGERLWRDKPEAEHLSTLISQPSTGQSVRSAYGLPERYFLSLGRMVEKKNLATLIAAYGRYCDEWRVTSDESVRQAPASLVFVGSGDLEGALREQARSLGLRVVERTDWKVGQSSHGFTRIDADGSERLAADRTEGNAANSVIAYGPSTASGPPVRAGCERPQSQAENCKLNTENSVEDDRGAVYFYGFRQIEENPVFYALAEAFVLPSLKEEWGLVVNEAMAAGLPVIVSRTAGCAEDLVPAAPASGSVEHGARSMESGENAGALNPQLSTLNSLEERSNGFVFDPSSVDALSEALRRIAEGETADGGAESARQPIGKPAATLKAEMGRRSREIVAKFGCENFARQALRAAEEASAP